MFLSSPCLLSYPISSDKMPLSFRFFLFDGQSSLLVFSCVAYFCSLFKISELSTCLLLIMHMTSSFFPFLQFHLNGVPLRNHGDAGSHFRGRGAKVTIV